MIFRSFLLPLFLLSVGCLIAPSHAATPWQALQPGLSYATLAPDTQLPIGHLHVFRVNLNRYQLRVALSPSTTGIDLGDLVKRRQALVAVNGGFFSPDLKPLGLRIDQGKQQSVLKPISWWGIFWIQNNRAHISPQSQFPNNANISFAVQSGPRLVVNGRIPKLKPGVANRTALGITRSGEVIILATENLPLTTFELAEIMRLPSNANGLDCVEAMNLDGGGSTQLFAQVGDISLDSPAFSSVADGVLVVPR